ncbi:MAG: hypothetical protein HY784_09355, partial [Chloroflexi bacterium]|nr:hypothetical protein [Chloroflexota bacterium]
LDRAQWIIFLMVDLNPDVPWSGALKQFLAQRLDLTRNRKVVVFAFNAPYYLDTTEITSLSAYFGLYGRAPAFVDVAARLLFQEVGAPGASPVSVPGVGYDLFAITQPDPGQVINLALESPVVEGTVTPTAETATPEALPVGLRLGDQVNLVAGPILDHNGHIVPDGTVVRFSENYLSENIPPLFVEATTSGGIARAFFRLDRTGLHEFRVSSDPAQRSQTLQIDVPSEGTGFITQVAPPTQESTATPEPTETPLPTPTSTQVIAPTPAPTETAPQERRATPADLLLALFVGGGMTALAYRFVLGVIGRRRAAIRMALAAVIGSLLGYNYFALGLSGANAAFEALGHASAALFALAGGAAGMVAGWAAFAGIRLKKAER